MTYDLKLICKRSWELIKNDNVSKSEAFRIAWKEQKCTSLEVIEKYETLDRYEIVDEEELNKGRYFNIADAMEALWNDEEYRRQKEEYRKSHNALQERYRNAGCKDGFEYLAKMKKQHEESSKKFWEEFNAIQD